MILIPGLGYSFQFVSFSPYLQSLQLPHKLLQIQKWRHVVFEFLVVSIKISKRVKLVKERFVDLTNVFVENVPNLFDAICQYFPKFTALSEKRSKGGFEESLEIRDITNEAVLAY